MKNSLLLLGFLVCVVTGYSQAGDTTKVNGGPYTTTTYKSPADILRNAGDVKGTIKYYRDTYAKQGKEFKEFYNYACALSIDYQIDSAFKYLDLALVGDSSESVFTDPDFLTLRKDKRWSGLEARQTAAIQKAHNNAYKDIEYAKRLWYMRATDQAYYDCIGLVDEKIGRNSAVGYALWSYKESMNEQNQKELEKLIAKKGWPRISQVGERAANAAFLVIQHSTLEKQKKYLPTIERLCQQKEASWQSYALMYDRIQTDENKPQKFGSQVRLNPETNGFELYPLVDETMVDVWRNEMGLGPLADYVAGWGITFKPRKK